MLRDQLIALVIVSSALACSGSDDRPDASGGFDRADPVDSGVTFQDAAPGAELGPDEDSGVHPDAEAGPDRDPLPQDAGLPPPTEMTFFVTSSGNGASGGNYGGLAGADDKCQQLAQLAGAGTRTWRAYLSTNDNGGGPIVHARDRIGAGPWRNRAGTVIAAGVDALHTNPPPYTATLDENGEAVPLMEHDILTGSTESGMSTGETCGNWTDGTDATIGIVGHSNWNDPAGAVTSWNSSHTSPCDEANLRQRFGSGRLYCFAID